MPSSLNAGVTWLYGRAYLLLTLTAFGWASNVVVSRIAVGHVSPMAVVSLRWIIVVALLALFAGSRIRADLPALLPRWRWIFLMGALGYTSFNSLFYIAAHFTSAIHLGIIQATMPAFVLLGGLLVFGTRIRLVQVVGVALTLAGVVCVAVQADVALLRALAFNVGDLMTVVACVLYSGYAALLANKPAGAGISLFAGFAMAAFVSSLPLLAVEYGLGLTQWPDALGWVLVAYIAVMPSLLAQLFFMRGVELIGPGRAGVFINLVPVFTALLSVGMLGEPFEPYHAAALALVLGGIWLAERGRRNPA